jgi:hypothetical protein
MSKETAGGSDAEPSLGAALALAATASSLDIAIGTALSRVGLSFTDFRRLRVVGAQLRGLTREDLAAAMGEPRSQTIRSSAPLVKLGWLSRRESGEFVLTDSGRHLVEQAEGIAEKAADRWFTDSGISPTEVTASVGSSPAHVHP